MILSSGEMPAYGQSVACGSALRPQLRSRLAANRCGKDMNRYGIVEIHRSQRSGLRPLRSREASNIQKTTREGVSV